MDSVHEFEILRREATLSSRVVAHLEGMIVGQELRPGDRLPTERELARQFGVSRTVVREAVTHLSAKSLLEAAPGGGALVKAPAFRDVSQSMTLLLRAGEREVPGAQVHEVRRMLETEIAGYAAARRNSDDIAKLRELLDEMGDLIERHDEASREKLVANDVGFHAALARATQNPLFEVLLNSVADIMLTVRRLGLRIKDSRAGALLHHRAIFGAVEAGDESAARGAMVHHLTESEEIMRRALKEVAEGTPEA